MGQNLWQDYEATYRATLRDPRFLAWRDAGARRKAENIVRVCRGLDPFAAVEIGCGTGSVLRALEEMNFAREYFCIDLSPAAVGFARDSCPALRERAAVAHADRLPLADGSFEVAILSHVIEHLEDPLAALREASRVARFVVVEVPTEKVLSNFVRTRILGRPYRSIREAGHVHFWSPSSIAAFLERDANLGIVRRHCDQLDESIDSGDFREHGTRPLLKRVLRNCLPRTIYSRLLTTHATFLCRPNGGSGARQGNVA